MKLWWNRGASAASIVDEENDEVLLPPHTEQAGEEARRSAAGHARTHPVLEAALAAGVTTRAEFDDLFAVANDARKELQSSCEKEAVRCFGQEQGPAKSRALEAHSYSSAKTMRDLWRDTANNKFGTTDSVPAGRQTQAENAVNGGAAASPAASSSEPVLDVNQIYAERAKQGG